MERKYGLMPVLIAFTNNCTIALQASRIVEGLCCRMMQSLWMCKWDRLIKKSMTSGRSLLSKQDSLLPSDGMFHQTGTETIAPDDVYSMQTPAPVSIATDVERNSEFSHPGLQFSCFVSPRIVIFCMNALFLVFIFSFFIRPMTSRSEIV